MEEGSLRLQGREGRKERPAADPLGQTGKLVFVKYPFDKFIRYYSKYFLLPLEKNSISAPLFCLETFCVTNYLYIEIYGDFKLLDHSGKLLYSPGQSTRSFEITNDCKCNSQCWECSYYHISQSNVFVM